MNRTYTPELAPEVLDRLDAYAARFRDDFNRPRQAQYSGVYLQGLILDGDRKSIEPLSRKVTLPPGLQVADLDQALQQFVGQSTWDEQAVWKRYRSVMAETFASPAGHLRHRRHQLPQAGQASPSACSGSTAGPRARGPTARSPPRSTTSRPKGHYPLAMRLYLPGGLAGRRRAARQGRRARGGAAGADQGADRPGAARPGAGRGAARPARGGRRRLRRLGAVPRRPGRSGACTTSWA